MQAGFCGLIKEARTDDSQIGKLNETQSTSPPSLQCTRRCCGVLRTTSIIAERWHPHKRAPARIPLTDQCRAKWRRVYHEFDGTRKKLGVTGASVYRDADDSSIVIATHNFKDISTAKAFVGSAELQSAMERAGVAGPPEIWFGEES